MLGATKSHLYDVYHGVLEEDKVHCCATDRLIVLTHEHLKSRVKCLIVWQLLTSISNRPHHRDNASSIDDKTELSCMNLS